MISENTHRNYRQNNHISYHSQQRVKILSLVLNNLMLLSEL